MNTNKLFSPANSPESVGIPSKAVLEFLERIMNRAFEEVYALSQEKKVSLRLAANMIALKRIVAVQKIRGIFP
jgi:glutamate dehydrogenase/leucine dehydrogenase